MINRDEFGAPLNAFETAATSNMPDWQLLADDVDDIHGPAPSSSKRSGSQLESTREPVSAKKRISKRLARNKGERSEQDTLEFEYKMRDRQAFRW